jgi:hypothetical protein
MTHGAYPLLYSLSREPLLLQASFQRAARPLLIRCGRFATNDLCVGEVALIWIGWFSRSSRLLERV